MSIVADEAEVEVLEEGLSFAYLLSIGSMALMDGKTEMHEQELDAR